jgi:predicted  nucleic acid-binding Zn-ribbon protein
MSNEQADFSDDRVLRALRAVLVSVKHRQLSVEAALRRLMRIFNQREDAIIDVVKLAVVELEREVAYLKQRNENR